jgi:hypothetical protein
LHIGALHAVASERIGAATHIQCAQRGFFARRKEREVVFERSIDRQRNIIRILKSEEAYWATCASKLNSEISGDNNTKLPHQLNELEKERSQILSLVIQEESKYVELALELNELTPELIRQGFA